ncbi:MAG: cupin domain-containing protein [Nanoarchaeota archaeon]|nr:cupin domain-containing protein [Nanoarchaeota archaeon]
MIVKNVFAKIPKDIPKEIFETLVKSKSCRIERIISKGHKTPNGEFYNQEENEFVLLVKGFAELSFGNKIVNLKEGDWINIPKHVKHRVEKTDTKKETIWLAVFYK